jgi:hypothetical protein
MRTWLIIIIIIFIKCKWVDTRWQWSFYILHIQGLWRLITLDLVGEGYMRSMERKNGNHPSICSRTQENQEKPVSRWPVAGPSGYWLLASRPTSKQNELEITSTADSYQHYYYYLLFSVALQPSAGYGLLWHCSLARAMASRHTSFLDHTRCATVSRTPLGRVISLSQMPLHENIQHKTDKHPCPGGIQTYDRSRRAVVDIRLRPRGFWDRRLTLTLPN